ncbi:MAG: prepilin peptidase [Anaerolineales bacterium]|nr:prepilin peptidase [Chloroflexota bacterium]MBL6979898.1 prepilin peptidase [Anaerolineales bacterium]
MGYILAAIIGWIGGSMVNYLCDVLPYKRRLVLPFCLNCNEVQPWWVHLFWPRRCSSCDTARSPRVWIVETLFVASSLWMWSSPPESLGYWVGITLLLYFGVVVVIDLEHRLILHPVSWAGVFLGLAVGIWLHDLRSTLIGGVVGFGLMFALHLFGNLFARVMTRIRGQKIDEVALGFGDVNLSGVLGLLLGWPGIVGGLVLAILFGGAVSLFYLLVMFVLRKYQAFTAIPYGPFLITSAILLLYFQDAIWIAVP